MQRHYGGVLRARDGHLFRDEGRFLLFFFLQLALGLSAGPGRHRNFSPRNTAPPPISTFGVNPFSLQHLEPKKKKKSY